MPDRRKTVREYDFIEKNSEVIEGVDKFVGPYPQDTYVSINTDGVGFFIGDGGSAGIYPYDGD